MKNTETKTRNTRKPKVKTSVNSGSLLGTRMGAFRETVVRRQSAWGGLPVVYGGCGLGVARWYRLTTVAGGWWWAEAEGEEGEGAAWERRRGKKFGGNWKMKVKWRELLLLYTFIAKAKASFTTHESLVTQHTGSPPCIFLLAFSCLLTLFSSWWLQSWPPNTCDLFNCFLFFYLEEKLKRWWVLTYQLNFNGYVDW